MHVWNINNNIFESTNNINSNNINFRPRISALDLLGLGVSKNIIIVV